MRLEPTKVFMVTPVLKKRTDLFAVLCCVGAICALVAPSPAKGQDAQPFLFAPSFFQHCPDTRDARIDHGTLYFTWQNPCYAEEHIRFLLSGNSPWSRFGIFADFDAKGHLSFALPLLSPAPNLLFRTPNDQIERLTFRFPDFAESVRVVLSWTEPVDLNLMILEPQSLDGEDATIDLYKDGVISVHNPNTDFRSGIGRLDIEQSEKTRQYPRVESYTIRPTDARLYQGQYFSIRLEFASRGRVPAGDYCDEGAYAAPRFTLYVLVKGQVRRSSQRLQALPCGIILDDNSYFRRVEDFRL